MLFIRQWSGISRKNEITVSSSRTVPNGVLPLKTIVSRVQQGNMFGISMNQVAYDSDFGDIDENAPHIRLYPNDPINSAYEYKNELQEIKKQAVKAVQETRRAINKKEVAEIKQPEEVTEE